MINVYERKYDDPMNDPIAYQALDASDAKRFIGKAARDLNYGLFRYWSYPGYGFYLYDCGPITFYVLENIEEDQGK